MVIYKNSIKYCILPGGTTGVLKVWEILSGGAFGRDTKERKSGA